MQLDTSSSNFQPIQTPRVSFDYAQDGGGQGGWNPSQFSPFFQNGQATNPGNAVTMSGGSFGGTPPLDPQMRRLNGGSMFGTGSPQYQQNLGGYNPAQYATQGTANTLAQALGGNVIQTQNNGPIQPPPQQMIDFGGDTPLNAGLLAGNYSRNSREVADQMLRDELRLQGPRQAPNEDSQGGSMGSWSMFGPSAGGSQSIGQGANMGSAVGGGQPTPPATPGYGATAPPPIPQQPPAAAHAAPPPAPPQAQPPPPQQTQQQSSPFGQINGMGQQGHQQQGMGINPQNFNVRQK